MRGCGTNRYRPWRGGCRGRVGLEDEVALAAQPIVDADAAFEAFRAVIGDDEEARGGEIDEMEEFCDLGVEEDVVIVDGVLEGLPGWNLRCPGSM